MPKEVKEFEPPELQEDQGTHTPNNLISPHHYIGRGGIEPKDFILSNKLSFEEGNVIKYLFRAPLKGKRVEDLMKAQVYLQWCIDAAIAEEAHIKG